MNPAFGSHGLQHKVSPISKTTCSFVLITLKKKKYSSLCYKISYGLTSGFICFTFLAATLISCLRRYEVLKLPWYFPSYFPLFPYFQLASSLPFSIFFKYRRHCLPFDFLTNISPFFNRIRRLRQSSLDLYTI